MHSFTPLVTNIRAFVNELGALVLISIFLPLIYIES